MKKLLAAAAAEIAYGLAMIFARRVSDAWIVRRIDWAKRLVERRKPGDHLATMLGDLRKIFADPKTSALARRLLLEARPAQFKALVRGAIL